MKIKHIALFIGFALLVTACSGGTQYVCPDGTTVSDRANCPPQDTQDETDTTDQAPSQQPDQEQTEPEQDQTDTPSQDEETETDTEESLSIDDRTQELFDEGRDRIDSIRYKYDGDVYHVRGNKIKVALEQETNYKETQPYSHVYINKETGEATGVCEADDDTWCPETTVHDADADNYYLRTPMDWIEAVKGATYEGNGMQLQKRSTHKISFDTGETEGTMYLLNYYNIPAKIELPDRTINYQEIATNSVKEEDVTR